MNKRILIIEDETELSGLLQKYLVRKNYDVTCVETLSMGMSLLHSFNYDAIILDNNLPDGKGIDAIPLINFIQQHPKIIAMSAMQVRKEALEAGASFYIEKPISMAAIYSLLTA